MNICKVKIRVTEILFAGILFCEQKRVTSSFERRPDEDVSEW